MSPLPETVETIDREIAELTARLPLVEGTECEVYTRCCGYYGSTKRFNPGILQQVKERVMFEIPA
jgi:hypothetical protein